MAYTEFYCQTTGSNLNAGSGTSDAAAFTYASGNWVAGTGVFTVASGDPLSDGVAVNDYASVYADGATVTGFVGKITARTTTTITVSLTIKSGTAPTDGTGTRTLKVGGAWKGPNGAEAFPFGFVAGNSMAGTTGQVTRVNLKSGTAYSVTAGMVHTALNGPTVFQGYTTTPGDLGKATIDGGTSGASYSIVSGTSNFIKLADLIFQNNGASGSTVGISPGTGLSSNAVSRDEQVLSWLLFQFIPKRIPCSSIALRPLHAAQPFSAT